MWHVHSCARNLSCQYWSIVTPFCPSSYDRHLCYVAIPLVRCSWGSKKDKLYPGYNLPCVVLKIGSTKNATKVADRILVVEDEPDIALTIKVALESEGFCSDIFTDPQEALKQYRRCSDSYFLVLSDVRMPEMSGFELVRRIRSIRPESNIVLMTSFEIDNSEFVKVFPSTKVDGFLQKPFSMSTLNELVLRYGNRNLNSL